MVVKGAGAGKGGGPGGFGVGEVWSVVVFVVEGWILS